MRHAFFPGLQTFFRRCLLLVIVLTGAFASAQALTNGNFESPYVAPNIDGWLKAKFLNPGLAGPTPYNGTSIVRNAGGVDKTSVFNTGAGPETQVDSDLGVGQSLRWPKFGASCVLINDHGNNQNGNSITQTFTLDNSMLDAGDGRLHLRFAFAPVLENPGHAVNQQPFFNIDVKDVSKANVILYDNLNFSNQPGSPWKTATSLLTGQTVVYTDWQIKDIALDPAVYLNDTIQIEFVAGGCSLGGHFGKLYVDGLAAVIPGLWVSVSSSVLAPPLLAGGTIRYTYTVRNTGVTPQTNVNINAVVPVNTTFVSLNDPGGRLSQAGGVISTTLPFPTSGHTMAPGDIYTFTVDVTVNGGTAAGTKITSGNYYAQADNYGSLYGSPVYDYVAGAGADLAASMTAALALNPCNTQFTVTITNNGPATASLAQASLPMPVNSTLVSATTTMGLVTGANPVVASLGDMASGATATFTVIVRPIVNTAVSGTVTVSGNFTDTVPANDSATASYANAAGGPAVSITTQPVGGTFPSGSTPTLTVAASGGCGGPFYQWYLNGGAIGGATGTSYTTPALGAGIYNYTVRVTEGSGYYVISNVAVVTIPAVVTVGALTNGTLDVTTPSPASVTPGSTTSFKFNANPGYHVASISGCSGPLYTNTSSAVSTYTYTTGAVTADCTITATFAINTYQVSASAGANGTLDVTTPSPVTINYGSTTSFKFNANPNYHIASISGCSGPLYTNTSNAVTTYTYTTGGITADCTVTATFAINTFQVSASAGANGTLDVTTPSPATINYGSTASFKFNANLGYHIASISGCSGPLYTNTSNAVTSYTYTTGAITAACTVTATYAINTYQVTATAGANGTLDVTTPSPVTINYGSTTSFKFNANLGYHIASISGCSGPLYTNTSNAVTSYTYTTGAITADCTVTATYAINTYTITATSSANGTISPSGLVVVNYGSNQTFIMTPNAAFGVLDVVVDGVSQGGLASYSFLNITSDHTISAVFAPGEEEPNNNYVQATRIAGPGTITGRIFLANDLDYYRVTLPPGSTLTATLMPLSSPANMNYFVYIYNQAGNIVAQSTRSGGVVNTAYIRNNSSTAFYYYAVIRAPYGFANPNWYQLNLNW